MKNTASGKRRVVRMYVLPAAHGRDSVNKYITKLNQTAQRVLNNNDIYFTLVGHQIDGNILHGFEFTPTSFISEEDFFEKIIDKTPLPTELESCSMEIKYFYV